MTDNMRKDLKIHFYRHEGDKIPEFLKKERKERVIVISKKRKRSRQFPLSKNRPKRFTLKIRAKKSRL